MGKINQSLRKAWAKASVIAVQWKRADTDELRVLSRDHNKMTLGLIVIVMEEEAILSVVGSNYRSLSKKVAEYILYFKS